jgi:cell division cycle protein 37
MDDVNNTYARIKSRAAELAKQSADQSPGVEQIQLHAVDPGTEIHINVPKPESEDPTEQESRKIFESFPPGLQRALESEKLDEVNIVLGKMSVEEAEEIVEQLGRGGMLSVEEEIIDATTEEGQKKLQKIESEGRKGRDEPASKTEDPE